MPDLDLRALARFLPVLEHADFSPGAWVPARQLREHEFSMPCADLSDAADDVVLAAYGAGWVLQHFDWVAWKGTREAIALYEDPAVLARATPLQLAQLLTVFIRQDRFVEGALLRAFQSGHILAIVRRAAALLDAGDAQPEP